MHEISVESMQLAIDNNEFEFFYQPQISLISGKLIGAEALIRWRRDDSVILPDRFIPLAEKTGFIRQITYALFDRFVHDASLLHGLNPELLLSINFSAKDLENRQLLEKIHRSVHKKLVDRKHIAIELTETAVVENLGKESFEFFKEIDIPLIMDDFGTGYASLSTLVDTPFSKIKIDRSLISHVLKDTKGSVVVKDNIRMAHRLGMDVVAEGVELGEVYEFLQNIGCSSVQGYLISRPMSLSAFVDYLSDAPKQWKGTPMGLLHLAQLDHIEWRKDLFDRVFGFEPAKDDGSELFSDAVIHSDKCMLGRWYYGEGQIFKGYEEFRKLEAPHHELHELGHRLIREATGDSPSTIAMLELSREITRKSIEILTHLHMLETHLMADMEQYTHAMNVGKR
jgi:EAL domain-containing protein (putative c-di-GMP-specific phosphodiesterase class I)